MAPFYSPAMIANHLIQEETAQLNQRKRLSQKSQQQNKDFHVMHDIPVCRLKCVVRICARCVYSAPHTAADSELYLMYAPSHL